MNLRKFLWYLYNLLIELFSFPGCVLNSSISSNTQRQDSSANSETIKRHTRNKSNGSSIGEKGHTRNKSNGSGIVGTSGHFHPGAFKPGHNRSASVLSKISRLSVRTLGWCDYSIHI